MAIESDDQLEAWLQNQSQELCSLFATRAALRAFLRVMHLQISSREVDWFVLIVARIILSACVRCRFSEPAPRQDVIDLANAAADGPPAIAYYGQSQAYHAAFQAYSNTDAYRSALNSIKSAANAFAEVDWEKARDPNIELNSSVIGAFYILAFEDANADFEELLTTPLWPDKTIPSWIYLPGNENVLETGPEWGFWQKWYQGWVVGKPLDWELQRRVALIENDIWQAGPEAVAEEIARIEAEFLAEKAPQAERVEFNTETGKFFTVPLDINNPNLLGATLSQVQDALEDVLANPSNGLNDGSRETRVLQRVFSKYGNDPQQIEMGFVSVHKGLTRQIVVSNELPGSEENLALLDALEEGARAIRATHPEVEENRKTINAQAIKELPEGAKETLEEALPVLVAISEDELADDWKTDIPQLINDAAQPLPTGAPSVPGVDESMRIFSRAAKISLRLRVKRVLDAIENNSAYRAATILGTIGGLVALGLSIFLGL